MSPFTDEDLQHLKKDLEQWMSPQFPLGIKEVKDLLARLEAAEKLCSYFHKDEPYLGIDEIEALEAWLKSKSSSKEGE